MKLIDCFYQDGVIDCYTFVFDEQNLWTNYYTMLATDRDGRRFSQWTEGYYDSEGTNTHLGTRPRFMSERLLNASFLKCDRHIVV
jgi:hypothetical protein